MPQSHPDHHSSSDIDTPRHVTLSALLSTGPGRSGNLVCSVQSDPPAQLQLFHQNHLVASTLQGPEELASSNPRLHVTVSPNELRLEIHFTELEDDGTYTCKATNTLGQASATAVFDAQGQYGREEEMQKVLEA